MEHGHDGHRQRIRERVLADGVSALRPHELVEYLLFFAVPRRNTNPLAHRLLAHFGSLQSLFGASRAELLRVEGMTASAAEWIETIGRAILAYAEPDDAPVRLVNRRQTRRYLSEFYLQPGVDGCWLLCLNASNELIHSFPLNAPGGWHSPENLRRAISESLNCHAFSIILAQRRDPARMTAEEREETFSLMRSLSRIQIALVEHMVIDRSGDSCVCATNPEILNRSIAESAPQLARWLDEL